MKKLLLTLLLYFPFLLIAQQRPLSESLKSSAWQFVYKITPNEARLFAKDPDYLDPSWLHTKIDSFHIKNPIPQYAEGNYIIVYTDQDKLKYKMISCGDLQMKPLINYRDAGIILYRKNGTIIKNAQVAASGHTLLFNEQTNTYRNHSGKIYSQLEIFYNNTLFLFDNKNPKHTFFTPVIQKWNRLKKIFKKHSYRYRYYDYFYNATPYENKYKGFVTFSKPRYRKGDTLQLKAFITNKKGHPVNKKLIVRLSDNSFDVDTIIGKIEPYRKGAYVFNIILNDAIDLDLDNNYLITLEELRSEKYDLENYDGDLSEDEYAKKRNVLIRGQFKLEDYELKSIQFNTRLTWEDHYRGNTQSIFLKATDENDLPVMDGRVIITVMSSQNNNNASFKDPLVFIPDTLFKTEIKLDPIGETKYDIPDSIFPAADFNYYIHCQFLNSENESHIAPLLQPEFFNATDHLELKEQADSLSFEFKIKDRSTPLPATISLIGSLGDTLCSYTTKLPASVIIHPMAEKVVVETAVLNKTWQLKPGRDKVSAITKRTKDSLFIQLVNPLKIPVWYHLFDGKKVIQRGYATEWTWNNKLHSKNNHIFMIHFIVGGTLYEHQFPLMNQDNQLLINVTSPLSVYPGQKTNIELTVSDISGHPVADADVTAFAITKKFKEYTTPAIPYLGKTYPRIRTKIPLQRFEAKTFMQSSWIHWQEWSKELGLDTIEYYKFLHPKALYVNTEKTPDSTTEFAPFVVSLGSIEPIYMLYLDEQPIYFKQAQQIAHYSFLTDTSVHQLKVRTQSKMITVPNIRFQQGVKSILSIWNDTSNHRIHIEKMPDTLTKEEQITINRYAIIVDHLYGNRLSYVEQGKNFYLLHPDAKNYLPSKVIGPIMPYWSSYQAEGLFNTPFEVEGAQHFTIRNGWIKQKPASMLNAFQKTLWSDDANINFKDLVMNKKQIDAYWEQYLFDNISEQYEPEKHFKGNARLHISIKGDDPIHPLPLKKILLFKYDSLEYLNIMHPRNTQLKTLMGGWYRAMILCRNNQFILQDSLLVKSNGLNHFTIDTIRMHAADSMSMAMAKILEERFLGNHSDNASAYKLLEQFNERYLNPQDLTGTVSGSVTDTQGQPVLGATIMIKGTRRGTTTDINGKFILKTPPNGTLLVQSVGYESIEKKISSSFMNVVLIANNNKLDEVVVVGYGSRVRKDLTGSIAGVSISEIGNPGNNTQLMIRGAANISNNAKPLIVVNGVIFEGELSNLDPESILSMDVLKDAAATAIYGERGSNGVIMINRKNSFTKNDPTDLSLATNNMGSLRTNFKDNAFWQPSLRTNAHGKVSFSVQFPDDLTNWKSTFIAMTEHKQSGLSEQNIRSFKPVSTQLLLPRFVNKGDSINIIGKSLNYTTDEVSVKRTLSIEKSTVRSGNIQFKNSYIDTIPVVVSIKDSLHLKIEIQKENGYFDGEQRAVPVLRTGTEESIGFFSPLKKDSVYTFNFDPAQGKIVVHATASILPALLNETEQIRTYKYDCNEQLASKLKALLMQKKIHSILKSEFKHEKDIQDIIKRLHKNSKDGLWGWWENNEPILWISTHVIESLLMAEKEKYTVALNKPLLIQELVYRANTSYATDKLYALRVLKLLDAKIDYEPRLNSLQNELDPKNIFTKLQWMELKQAVGAKINTDSLLKTAQKTLFGNIYWGEQEYRMFDNSIELTLMVYKILRNDGNYTSALELIRGYFIEQRKTGQWNNTFQSSQILETILPDLYKNDEPSSPAVLSIEQRTKQMIQQFPYHAEFDPREKINVQKNGDLPLYFTAYQQQWNENPQAISKSFTVHSFFKRNNDTLTYLKAGDNVDIQVKIDLKEKANYVMIEIPIPAGCSYASKPQPFNNNEVHREYYREKTSIFCSELLPGTYTFSIPLTARFTGAFYLNPAKASQMYFPVLFGREGIKKIEIKGK